MNNIAQINSNLNTPSSQTQTLEYALSVLMAPHIYQMSYLEYGNFFDNIGSWMRKFTLSCIAKKIEEADLEFKNSLNRTKHYHVKVTRPRTIITIIGPLTYTRTEYVDILNNDSPFIPIDRKLGLLPRQRYDVNVQAKAKELYADHNSMIKVGKILGEMIYNHFSLDPNRHLFNIPRQTIYNFLRRIPKIYSDPERMKETPETLYIMADEKWVPLQGESTDEKPHVKEMVKVAVCFEGKMREINKKGELTNRYHLVNKYTHAACVSEKEIFWSTMYEKLSKRYDLTKVKAIYILGDGATWIKGAINEFTMPETRVRFALDRFHASQAIHKMTTNETYRDLLTYYLYNNMKNDFMTIANFAKDEKKNSNTETFDKNYEYLLNNWNFIQVMVREVMIGCPMEQAISHIIASPFTSVPKAYGRKNLPSYLNSRIHLQNGEDILTMHLKALQAQKHVGDPVDLKEEFDWSFFEDQEYKETYTVHIRNRSNKKTEYSF